MNEHESKIIYSSFCAEDGSMSYKRSLSRHPSRKEFMLHTHDGYEIFIFIKGSMIFLVEGTSYNLQPYDIIIVRNGEMHDIYPTGEDDYERIVINISSDFFESNGCEIYREIFVNRPVGKNNLIPGHLILISEIVDILPRIEKYLSEIISNCDTIIKCVIIELLHAMNHLHPSVTTDSKHNSTVCKAIDYINQNLNSDLSLDHLAEQLFVSKYHLCRVFREHTGYTVNNYIIKKRLLLIQELCRNGESISSACLAAGFSSYSSFYKSYVKFYGCSPKIGLFNAD